LDTGKKRICGCCIKVVAGDSVRVMIRVRERVRISNRVRGELNYLTNHSLIAALPIAKSADPLIRFLPVALALHSK